MPVTINGSGAISGLVITTADLADSSVTTSKIADGAVATADLANGAVTNAKMATGAAVANIGFTPADATATVNLTGNQSIGGTKTFTSGITFNDGTTQTTAAGAVTVTAVLNATSGAAAGLVGTYAWLAGTTDFTQNSTYAGSNLRWAGQYSAGFAENLIFQSTTAPSGTWRAMGFINSSSGARATLFLRVA